MRTDKIERAGSRRREALQNTISADRPELPGMPTQNPIRLTFYRLSVRSAFSGCVPGKLG
jgi:hypothetical protein